VAVVHALTIVVALVLLASLPCLIALAITSADEYIGLAWRGVRRALRACRRWLAARPGFGWLVVPEPPAPIGPPIQQIAADLRRLQRQRLEIATRSTVWFAAVQRAYDERLCMACRCLDIEQHLDSLEGIDREIERIRLEGELAAAGLVISPVDADRRPGRP